MASGTAQRVIVFSPQAWGCTGFTGMAGGGQGVFPTGVGVYRTNGMNFGKPESFPHRRGGVPFACGCLRAPLRVFPTGVGVYRLPRLCRRQTRVFPTGVGVYRRGDPDYEALSVFPTGVGVYR